MRKMISFQSVLAVSLIACGGGNSSTPDAKAVGSGSGSACPIATTFSPSFTGSSSEADHFAAGSGSNGTPEEVDFFGNLDAAGDIEVDLFILPGSDFPTFPAVSAAKTVDLASTEMDVGAVVLADPNAQGQAQVLYATVSGSVTITSSGSAGATFSGSASNLVFAQADKGSNGLVPDPDHCMSTMSFSFTGMELVGSNGFEGAPTFARDQGARLLNRFH
jgi:hypothetical protein